MSKNIERQLKKIRYKEFRAKAEMICAYDFQSCGKLGVSSSEANMWVRFGICESRIVNRNKCKVTEYRLK